MIVTASGPRPDSERRGGRGQTQSSTRTLKARRLVALLVRMAGSDSGWPPPSLSGMRSGAVISTRAVTVTRTAPGRGRHGSSLPGTGNFKFIQVKQTRARQATVFIATPL